MLIITRMLPLRQSSVRGLTVQYIQYIETQPPATTPFDVSPCWTTARSGGGVVCPSPHLLACIVARQRGTWTKDVDRCINGVLVPRFQAQQNRPLCKSGYSFYVHVLAYSIVHVGLVGSFLCHVETRDCAPDRPSVPAI